MKRTSTQNTFSHAPNFHVSGLEGKRQMSYEQDHPAVTLGPHRPIELHQVHQKASMLQGELKIKETTKSGRGKVFLLFDSSLSCIDFFGSKDSFDLFVIHLCEWLDRYQWKWELLFSSNSSSSKWDQKLWQVWHQKIIPQQNAVALVFSDFLGERPDGLFWKQLQSLPSSHLIWWQHPFSISGDQDIEDLKDQKRKLQLDFLQRQKNYIQQLERTWSLMGLSYQLILKDQLSNVENQVSKYLS